jgi:hypothetical protein
MRGQPVRSAQTVRHGKSFLGVFGDERGELRISIQFALDDRATYAEFKEEISDCSFHEPARYMTGREVRRRKREQGPALQMGRPVTF